MLNVLMLATAPAPPTKRVGKCLEVRSVRLAAYSVGLPRGVFMVDRYPGSLREPWDTYPFGTPLP